MYRPPFRQQRPHIATGVASESAEMPVSAGAATKAFAPPMPKHNVSSVAATNPSLASVIMMSLWCVPKSRR